MRDDLLIGSEEACALLGVHRATLLRWAASDRVRPVHKLPGPNGAYLFSRGEIVRLAKSRMIRREGAA